MTLAPADASFIERLRSTLPASAIREVEPRYLEEPRGQWAGQAGVVVAPASTDEVASAIALAAEASVGVVPYGGGTGLVGGQIAPDGPAPMLLSLERMANIRSVYAKEVVLVAEAGATIQSIQDAAAEADLLFPLSYASQGTAQIGAALSVNSGGLNVLRYGTARAQCLGIEAVLPDGRIMHGLKRLRKDNTGYDLRNLLIGSEGTLGIITAAALSLVPRPARQATGVLAVDSPTAALDLLRRMRDVAGEAVSAFELISGLGLRFLAQHMPEVRIALDTIPRWCVLTEIGTGPRVDPEELMLDVFERAMADGLVSDGVLAASDAQRSEMWVMRESIPAVNRKVGAVASHDIALPLSEVAGFFEHMGSEIARMSDVRINAFGHLGDGNLHYNFFPAEGRARSDYADIASDLSRAVHDRVAALGGSFSAEHGVGRLKVAELERYGDPVRLDVMRAIKHTLDPSGIMNPGAVLRMD